jgi:hypothetical protein
LVSILRHQLQTGDCRLKIALVERPKAFADGDEGVLRHGELARIIGRGLERGPRAEKAVWARVCGEVLDGRAERRLWVTFR